jgi:hypothetical protein
LHQHAATRTRITITRNDDGAITLAFFLAGVLTRQCWTIGQTRQFTGQSLLLSHSLPNFYFHATTAYDIIRQCGVEIGKRDFMGAPSS